MGAYRHRFVEARWGSRGEEQKKTELRSDGFLLCSGSSLLVQKDVAVLVLSVVSF